MKKRLVSTAEISKTEWLKYRKMGIGGSEAGAVCGLNPYKTAMEVYQDKISEEAMEEPEKDSIILGRELEDYIARRFMQATGKNKKRELYVSTGTISVYVGRGGSDDRGRKCRTGM